MTENTTVRLDKWLWAARFFPTRSMAAMAVSGGHVQVNGLRAKSSRLLRVGELLRIRRGEEVYEVEVLALSDRRVGASLVSSLCHESEESRSRRALAREQRRGGGSLVLRPPRRPDKRDRRKILEFLQGEE